MTENICISCNHQGIQGDQIWLRAEHLEQPLPSPLTCILSVPKFTANLYCICLSIPQNYTYLDDVQNCGKF